MKKLKNHYALAILIISLMAIISTFSPINQSLLYLKKPEALTFIVSPFIHLSIGHLLSNLIELVITSVIMYKWRISFKIYLFTMFFSNYFTFLLLIISAKLNIVHFDSQKVGGISISVAAIIGICFTILIKNMWTNKKRKELLFKNNGFQSIWIFVFILNYLTTLSNYGITTFLSHLSGLFIGIIIGTIILFSNNLKKKRNR